MPLKAFQLGSLVNVKRSVYFKRHIQEYLKYNLGKTLRDFCTFQKTSLSPQVKDYYQDYYQEIVNLQVSSRVGQQFTFWICLELKVSAQPTTQIKILTVVVKKLALKVSIEKPFLLYFVNLSAGL